MWLEIAIALFFGGMVFTAISAAKHSATWLFFAALMFLSLGMFLSTVGIDRVTGYTWVENRPIDPGSSDLNRTDMNISFTSFTSADDVRIAVMSMVSLTLGVMQFIFAAFLLLMNALETRDEW